MSPKIKATPESQDLIRWRNFTRGYISAQIYEIQNFHMAMSNSNLIGPDWIKQIYSRLLIHIDLHDHLTSDKCHNYLYKKKSEELLNLEGDGVTV